MIRRLTIVGLVSLLLLPSCLFAEDGEAPPTSEELSQALTVIMDCVSASLVTECTATGIELPCSNVLMDSSTNLPKRISYFLADPSEYVNALAPKESGGGLFASIAMLINGAVENPMASAVYMALASRGYEPYGYFLSGYISFSYTDGVTLDDVLDMWAGHEEPAVRITMGVDMNVYGASMARPISLNGTFEMHVGQEREIVVSSIGVYSINGYGYKNGEFTF